MTKNDFDFISVALFEHPHMTPEIYNQIAPMILDIKNRKYPS